MKAEWVFKNLVLLVLIKSFCIDSQLLEASSMLSINPLKNCLSGNCSIFFNSLKSKLPVLVKK